MPAFASTPMATDLFKALRSGNTCVFHLKDAWGRDARSNKLAAQDAAMNALLPIFP